MPKLRALVPKASILAAVVVVPCHPLAPTFAGTYQEDDGTCDGIVQVNHYQGHVGTYLWMNRFVAAPGMETITSVTTMFGQGLEHNGLTIEALLWKCSPSSLLPKDATLVSRASGVISNMSPWGGPMNQLWNTFDIPDVALSAGEKFYVGIIVYDVPALPNLEFSRPFAVDRSHTYNGGYVCVVEGVINPANLGPVSSAFVNLSNQGPLGTLMLTANGVPGPGAAPILAMGLIACSRRRRER